MILPQSACTFLSHAVVYVAIATTTPDSLILTDSTGITDNNNNIPVLEIVKVYGRIAGSQCYGKIAPPGSSCQVRCDDFKKDLGLLDDSSIKSGSASSSITREDFVARIESMNFRWPLKPFGVDDSPSLSKTAVMNKGAETRIFMDELEQRGLYDKRNPTGPLPTSLRPKLNKQIQQEGIQRSAVDYVFDAFLQRDKEEKGKETAESVVTASMIDQIFRGKEAIDYYEFLKIIGPQSITWPNI